MESSTATDKREEGILGVECSQESGEWNTRESHVEEYYSTGTTGVSGVELGDERSEYSSYPSEQEEQEEKKKKKKPLVIALSVVIPVLVIAIIAAVCCVLLIRKTAEAPSITASVEMNEIKRDIKEGELVNKLPTFFSPSFEILEEEDASCYMESRRGVNGKKVLLYLPITSHMVHISSNLGTHAREASLK